MTFKSGGKKKETWQALQAAHNLHKYSVEFTLPVPSAYGSI